MSFSGNVKDELAGHMPGARHCQIAELAAILQFCARIVKTQSGKDALEINAENETVLKKCFTLLRKTFNIETSAIKSDENMGVKLGHSAILLDDPDIIWNIFQTLKLVGDDGVFY